LIAPKDAIGWRTAGASRRTAPRRSRRSRRRPHRAQLEAGEVEHVERDLVPFADFGQDILRRHFRPEDQRCGRRAVQAHLVFFLAALHTPRALDERAR
jgi:hypothetical protein